MYMFIYYMLRVQSSPMLTPTLPHIRARSVTLPIHSQERLHEQCQETCHGHQRSNVHCSASPQMPNRARPRDRGHDSVHSIVYQSDVGVSIVLRPLCVYNYPNKQNT